MLSVLHNPAYVKLFSAQIIALTGTGLLTVALGLLAFDIAGGDAGRVLGTAMTVKMVAYVGVSPVATALTATLPRRAVLIGADLARAATAAVLPFVTETWQIYLLIFVLQSASATFTPTFQALIPSILPQEDEYTRALSLSRLAYDLEALVSPVLAAALLTVTGFHSLFAGTVIGFLGSATLVAATRLPRTSSGNGSGNASPPDNRPARFTDNLTRGIRLFLRSPELRGLAALNLTVAAVSSMVIVNSVVLVREELARPQQDLALLLCFYGGGSMIVALGMPRLLEHRDDRRVMLVAAVTGSLLLLGGAVVIGWAVGSGNTVVTWAALLILWALSGAATSGMLTPSARLLRRASSGEDRPTVFAAQFALSHACFLVCYPVAGQAGATVGLPWTAVILAVVGLGGAALAYPGFTASR